MKIREWKDTSVELPVVGDEVIVKLDGCKKANYAYLRVREGEGLGGWFNGWCYAGEKEREEYNLYLEENGKVIVYLKIKEWGV